MATQLPPSQLLIQQLPQLFTDKDEAWIGDAAWALSHTAANANAIAGIVNMADAVKRRFVERELEAAGANGQGSSGDVAYLDVALKDGKTDFREVTIQHGRVNLREAGGSLGIQLQPSCLVSREELTAEQRKNIDWKACTLQSWSIEVRPGSFLYVQEKPGPNWLIKAFLAPASNNN